MTSINSARPSATSFRMKTGGALDRITPVGMTRPVCARGFVSLILNEVTSRLMHTKEGLPFDQDSPSGRDQAAVATYLTSMVTLEALLRVTVTWDAVAPPPLVAGRPTTSAALKSPAKA